MELKDRIVRVSLVLFVLVLALAGVLCAKCPVGDLNRDCRVDGLDFAVFANQWMGDPNGTANLNEDAFVDARDLAILADRWGRIGCPVIINELLAHSHDIAPDWIELYNLSSVSVDLGGWMFSDDENEPNKYVVPAGTIVEPNDYIVFYENETFGNPDAPGVNSPFRMSENGEVLYLRSDDDAQFPDCDLEEAFGASVTNASFGRHLKSTGTTNFVIMSEPTPGERNAYPLVGPVVINEIMYRPAGDGDAEYVELLNISGGPVTLYDFDAFEPWRFVDETGIDFSFPANDPMTLQAGEHILLARDASLVRRWFSVPTSVRVLEWNSGKLSNSGEKIRLIMPGDVDEAGTRYWIEVDRLNYSDGSHGEEFNDGIDPWPRGADGLGLSLNRLSPLRYGNDPNNWQATIATPGQAND